MTAAREISTARQNGMHSGLLCRPGTRRRWPARGSARSSTAAAPRRAAGVGEALETRGGGRATPTRPLCKTRNRLGSGPGRTRRLLLVLLANCLAMRQCGQGRAGSWARQRRMPIGQASSEW